MREMKYQSSMRELGLLEDAGVEEVLRAYKKRSRTLKSLITGARTAADKDRYRAELRHLVRCRAVALGQKPQENWAVDRFPISSTSLMTRLTGLENRRISRKAARAFLGLPRDATQTSILDAYQFRSRVLLRRLARAKADDELNTVHRSRSLLRSVRDVAL